MSERRLPRWSTDGGIHEIPMPQGVPGRMWLCGKHHIGPDVEGVLHRTGATTVVCLTERAELVGRYPSYVAWLDDQAGRSARWFPIHDLSAPTLPAARDLWGGLAGLLLDGEGIVVHCAAGIGRAGTTAIGVLMLMGVPLDDARDVVRANRPMAGPEAGAQLDLLLALEESLR